MSSFQLLCVFSQKYIQRQCRSVQVQKDLESRGISLLVRHRWTPDDAHYTNTEKD